MKNLLVLSMLTFMSVQLSAQGLVLQKGTTLKKFKQNDLLLLTIPTDMMNADGEYCNYIQIKGKVKRVSSDSIELAVSSYKKTQLVTADTKVEDWISSPNMSLASTVRIDQILVVENLKSHKHQQYKGVIFGIGFTLLSIGVGSVVGSLAIKDRANKGTLLGIAAGSFFSGITLGLLSGNKSYKLKETDDPWRIVAY
jgi:hypothetical protein